MSLINDEPTGKTDDINVEELLTKIEQGESHQTPADPGTPAPDQTQVQAQAPQAPVEPAFQGIEFDYNGRPIKLPFTDPKVKTWAQQGYDYSQKMAALNQERQKILAEKEKYEKTYGVYKNIDEYARKNPAWFKYIENSFNQAQQGNFNTNSESPDMAMALAHYQSQLEDKLKPFEEKFKAYEERDAQERISKEDQALDKEIQSIRTQYPKLDWSTPDESGLTLEQRVLKHAIDNKIESFRAAFRDFNYEHLLKLHEESGKEKVNQEIQKRAKLGIIGTSPTSKKEIQPVSNLKQKSYENIHAEVLAELGIG